MIIFEVAVKSIAVALIGLTLALAMKKGSGAQRHFALVSTLFGLCLLPLAPHVGLHWSMPVGSWASSHLLEQPAPIEAPAFRSALDSSSSGSMTSVQPEASATYFKAPTGLHMEPNSVALLIWAAGAAFFGARLLGRLVRLRSLETRLQLAEDGSLYAKVAEYCRSSRQRVLVLEGEASGTPMTWGHGRPVLLLPADAATWPENRLKSVVLHELAHIERADWTLSIFGQLVTAAFWFNPLVWMILRRMEAESEIAADDRVIAQGVRAPQYAAHLIELARQFRAAPRSARPAIAMARRGPLDGRICSILETRRSRKAARGMVAVGLIGSIACVASIVGSATISVAREAKIDRKPAFYHIQEASAVQDVTLEVPTAEPSPDIITPTIAVPMQVVSPKPHAVKVAVTPRIRRHVTGSKTTVEFHFSPSERKAIEVAVKRNQPEIEAAMKGASVESVQGAKDFASAMQSLASVAPAAMCKALASADKVGKGHEARSGSDTTKSQKDCVQIEKQALAKANEEVQRAFAEAGTVHVHQEWRRALHEIAKAAIRATDDSVAREKSESVEAKDLDD